VAVGKNDLGSISVDAELMLFKATTMNRPGMLKREEVFNSANFVTRDASKTLQPLSAPMPDPA